MHVCSETCEDCLLHCQQTHRDPVYLAADSTFEGGNSKVYRPLFPRMQACLPPSSPCCCMNYRWDLHNPFTKIDRITDSIFPISPPYNLIIWESIVIFLSIVPVLLIASYLLLNHLACSTATIYRKSTSSIKVVYSTLNVFSKSFIHQLNGKQKQRLVNNFGGRNLYENLPSINPLFRFTSAILFLQLCSIQTIYGLSPADAKPLPTSEDKKSGLLMSGQSSSVVMPPLGLGFRGHTSGMRKPDSSYPPRLKLPNDRSADIPDGSSKTNYRSNRFVSSQNNVERADLFKNVPQNRPFDLQPNPAPLIRKPANNWNNQKISYESGSSNYGSLYGPMQQDRGYTDNEANLYRAQPINNHYEPARMPEKAPAGAINPYYSWYNPNYQANYQYPPPNPQFAPYPPHQYPPAWRDPYYAEMQWSPYRQDNRWYDQNQAYYQPFQHSPHHNAFGHPDNYQEISDQVLQERIREYEQEQSKRQRNRMKGQNANFPPFSQNARQDAFGSPLHHDKGLLLSSNPELDRTIQHFKQLAFEGSPVRIRAVFTDIDLNGDGAITLDEFQKYIFLHELSSPH